MKTTDLINRDILKMPHLKNRDLYIFFFFEQYKKSFRFEKNMNKNRFIKLVYSFFFNKKSLFTS